MATYNGTNGNNTITGSSSGDTMNGLDGNDVLNGGAGNDTIDGGNNDDTLIGGTGNDKLYGRDGDDNLDGGDGDDRLDGGNGKDVITGGSGRDTVSGGDGEDTIDGGDGNDTLDGGASQDVLRGGAGNDSVKGGDGDDKLFGGTGNDSLDGGTGQDVIYGDYDPAAAPVAQSATVTFNSESADNKNSLGYYEIDGAGNIVGVKFVFANASASGSGGSMVAGNSATVTAAAGNSLGFFIVANGYAVNNSYSSLNLTTGHLEFRNADGSPATTASTAPQLYYVNASGVATALAGATYHAAAGSQGAPLALNADGKDHASETLNSNGTTTLKFEDLNNLGDADFNDLVITVNADLTASGAANYNDNIVGGDGDDKIYGQFGNDNIEGGQGQDEIYGGEGNDSIDGDTGDDRIYGGAGNDTLRGDDNNDHLFGEDGNDNIFGGTGDDQMDGGAGNDVVKGDDGNDTATYVASENVGSHDVYEGNKGWDTLKLVLTQAQYSSASVQQDIANYQAFLANNSNPNFSGGPTFHFNSFDLDVRTFENLQVVVVAPPNSAPDAVNDAAAVTEDQYGIVNVLSNDSTGGDVGDALTVSGVAATSSLGVALSVNANGTVNYNAAGSAYLQTLKAGQTITDSFTYTVTDQGGLTDTATVTVTITGVNDAPTVAAMIADMTAAEDAAFTLATAGNFADIDVGDTRSYSATLANGNPLPSWLSINAATGVISGTPANGDVGSISVKVTMTDGSGASANDTFNLTVTNTNDGPTVAVAIPDTATPEDALFTFATAGNFADVDVGDTRAYSATLSNGDPLPSWLTINAATGVLSGTPTNGDVGMLAVKVTMTDGAGASANDTFNLTVANVNDAPVVTVLIPDQSAAENAPFSYDTSGNFTDDDFIHGDSLTYTATLANGDPLPPWLTIDPNTGVISGTPPDVGAGSGLSGTVTFVGETAGYRNSLGSYEIDGSGNISAVKFVWDNSSRAGDGGSLVGGVSTAPVSAAPGNTLGFFLIANGYDVNGQYASLDLNAGHLEFRDSLGNPATTSTVNPQLWYVGTSGSQHIGGDIYHSAANNALNADGLDHTEETALGGGVIQIGFEDLNGLGDQDFDDTIFNLQLSGGATSYEIVVTATDESGASASDSFLLTIENVNDAPVVSVSIPDQTTPEDALFTYETSANFSDDDAGDSLSYTATLANGDPLPAWLSINPTTGQLFGTPANGDVGGISVLVTATDESGESVSDVFDLTVTNVNDAPVVSVLLPNQGMAEDVPFSFNATGYFTDVDLGDSLTYSATLLNGDPLPSWLSIDPVTGILSGTPANGDVGNIGVVVTVTDESGAHTSDAFGLTVTNVNDVPVVTVAVPDQVTNEDAAFTYNAAANFADVDVGDALSYTATLANGDPLPAWLSFNGATGVFSGTPANGDVGALSITVTAIDNSNTSVSDTFVLTVANVNDAPVVTVGIADQSVAEDAGFSLEVSGNFDDIDLGDVLSYSATLANGDPLPAWLSINGATGQISGTPANGDVGAISIIVTATDLAGATASDTFDLTVANVNDVPVVTVAIPDQTTNEDAAFSYDASANFDDVDAGDVLTYTATLANGDPLPSWLSIDANTGVLSGTPDNGDVGVLSLIVSATDGSGATVSDAFDLTVENVNDTPVVTVGIADASTNEDATFSYDASANFADDDTIHGDVLSYSATLANGDPLPAWLSINPVTGELSGTPANGDVGALSIIVTATDLAGETASDTFDLTVVNTNDGPTVTVAIADQTTDEDAAFSLDVSGNFADVDLGDVLSYSATLANGDPLPAWLSINPTTGELSGTPANGDVGAISVLVTATDLAGSTASDTFDLTVENVNDAPVVTLGIADATTNEDAAFSYDAAANFTDDDTIHGDVLSYSATLANGDPLPAWLSINGATGELSGTPANGDVGVYSIIVTATDLAGATASDTFDLSVANVNDTPVVTIGIADQTTDEDAAFSFDVSGNFADIDLGDVLSFSATLSNGDPLPTWLSIDPVTGELSGTPANGDVGAISVLVTATDLSGATASDVFDLTVENVNDAPVVTVGIADAASDEDAAFSYDASANFADDDSIHGDVLSYSATLANGDPLPAWLSINAATGELSGTPANGDVGAISILVTATDLAGATASDMFDLTVVNTNDGPTVTVAIADQTTDEDAAFSFDVSGNFADVDLGDVLSFTATLANGDPLPAWLSINAATGELSGTPANGDVGGFSVTVTATDGSGATAADTFDLTVTNVNDAPVVTVALADLSTDEDAAFMLDASASFADDDTIHGDVLSYTATLANGDPLPAWLSINAATGELSGTPANGDVGAISILVTATDLAGATASDIFDLTIVNTNDGPTVSLAIPDQVTPEDAGFSFDVSGNFADVDLGDVLTFTATLANGDPLPSWLSFNSATGTFSGTPDNWDVGSLSVLVTASDLAGATASDTFDITVSNVNDAPVVTVALADQTVVEDAPFSYDTSAHFGDDDFIHGDSLTYTATLANGDPLPAWLSINPTTGVISGLLAHGAVGGDSFQNGTPSNNTINGNALNNTIDAGAGHDTVNAGAGNDDITAGSGNDTVYGGTGNDLIDGGSGTDSIEGGAGNDNITGGSGNDTIYGDYESLIASGSPLVITVTATDESGVSASDTFDLKFPANDDSIDAGSGSDYVDGGQGDDVVIHRVGENIGASDVYTGNTGHDTLRLVLTSAEAADSQIQQDIAAYQAFLLTHNDPNSDSGDTFQFSAFDLQVSNFENLEVVVEDTNTAPVVATPIADTATDEDAGFSYDVSGNFYDPDFADPLLYSAVLANGDPLPAWLSIDANSGTLSGTPDNDDVGLLAVVVTVTDSFGESASDTFNLSVVNVNDAPVVTVALADAALVEDAAFSYDVSGAFADDDSIHGDVLSYTATLANGDPLPAWLSINAATGELSGTPANGDVGAISIIVTATDLAGATASDTFDLTITNVNDVPMVTIAIADQTTDEDALFSLDVSSNFADADLGDSLTFAATLSNGDPLPAWLSINAATGELSGTPANGDVGVYAVIVMATDLAGASASDTFDLTVTNVNDVPVVTVGIADATVAEDALFSYDAAANFADDDSIHGDVLSFSATLANGDPLPAWLSINAATGELSGTPANGDVGAISIIVIATDLAGATASDTFDLTIDNVNDTPVVSIAIADQTTDEDALFSLDVSGNFADVDLGDVLTFSATLANGDPLPAWLSINSTTGELSGTPANGDVGLLSIRVTATDGAGATASDEFDLTVENVNDAPVVTVSIADATVAEDALFSYEASANFDDVDLGDVLSYSATLANGDPLPAWLSINPATGELSGTPANGDVGAISIIVTATDLAGATASDTFDLTITNSNDGPTVAIALADQTTAEDALFSLDVSGSFADVDLGDVLTFSATLANGDPLPAWLSINAATGELSGTPENSDVGVISVLVTATDSEGATASDTFDLTVTNVNDAPIVTLAIDDQIATQDAAFSYDLSGNFADVDLGDVLSYSATLANGDPLPAWLSINPTTGELSGTPANGDVGLLSILVTATDLAGATASDIFDLTIDNENDVPTVTLAIADQTTDEDALFSLDVSGNFADSDLGDELSYSATLANGDPLPAWLSIDPVTGELSGTPENGDVGGYSVTVTATDLAGASASDTFDLTVINVNDAPVVSVEIPDLNALEDASFSLDAASHFDDVDLGDELSYTASLANGDPLPAWLSFDGNTGTFSGTPTSGFVGVISLIVTATDLAGASVTEAFDITVENVNDAPTLTSTIPDQVADEDAAFVYDLSPHFADADIEFGDSLGFDAVLYSAILPNGDPLPGWLSINPATGELFGTPSNEDVGVMTIVITATDSASESVSTSFTLTVSNVNDAPVVLFEADPLSTNEGEEFGYSMADHFDDVDFIHGDVLTYTATLANGDPLPAWLSLNPATGEIVGTPTNGDVGLLSILVTVTDVAGETASTTLELTIDNVNETPTVVSAIVDQITDEDAPFSLDVSGNFADSDLGDELSYTATLANGDPLPAWLSIDPVTGELSGTPENGDVGAISIVVTVTDLAGATASDEFAITVLNTNDGPVATVDAVAATEDVAITYLAADLLANDSDIDVGDVLTISGVSNAVGGTAELTVDGDVLFTPTANFSGTASFDYTVADGNGGFSTATVTVAVAAVADAPIVTAEDVVAVEVPAPVPNFEGGDEFFANDTTAGNQVVPSVLGLANGNFVTVWSSVDAQDGDYSGVFAKIYAPDGSAVTAEFQVNTFTSSDQLSRSVTSLANGDFVITWTSGGQDGDSWGIYGQRFTVDGTPVGGEFAINTETSGSQESPTVTSLADGGFLIAWQSYSGSQDGSGSGIYAQRFDAASSPVGSEFIVNTTTANSQALPVAAGLADGGYVVAWQSEGSQDGWSLGIYAQRYDADGNAVGGEFQVNSFWIGDQSVPSITALASGGFVVTWQADGYSWAPNQDSDNWGIYSRVYDANGNALTGEILVNSTTENQQIQPSVTALADGGYFVSWSSFNTVNNTWDVYGQRFDAAAHKVGDELLINSTTDGTQWQPSVTTLANGSLVVSWYDYGHDGSGAGIATRIFTLEDTGATIAVAGLDIQAALADLDGSESILSVLISDLPAGATLSAGTNNGNGSWSLTPAQLAGLEVSMPVTPPATYSLTVAVTSIEGANGDTATTTITFNLTVPDFNHAPIVTFAIVDQTIAQEDAFSLDVSGNFDDVDLGDVLTYSATLANGDPLPAWLSINPTTGELSGTPDNGDVGSISITVTATDEGGLSASDTLDVTVTNVNDTPVVTVEIADQATAEDALFSLDVSGNFADADIGDVLTYSITGFHGDPLPSWISIDPNTGVISGTPDNDDVGSFTVEVSATDASGAFVRESFILTVENVNDAPVVTILVADGSVDAGELFSQDLSAHFADDDTIHGDVLTYSATLGNGDPLPAWLSIDPNSGVISGTPGLGDIGAISIIVTVTDIAGATASDMFDLAITDVNSPPVLSLALADQAADEDALFSYDVSGNFTDGDLGDALAYTATLANGDPLPSWLSIDANTGVISGVPSNTDVTTTPISILVTATDLDGLNASDTFDLTVDNVNDAPVVTVGLGNENTWVNAPFTYETAASFADVDGIHGDTLTFSATLNNGDPLPSWLSIDPQTGLLSGTPIFGNTGTLAVTVTATDLAGATASDTFNLTVTPVETDGGTPSQLINTYFIDNQLLPDVTTLTNGDVVLVWSSLGQDGSSWGVYGQRVEQDGTPVGGEFHINTTTIDSQIDPSITELADGGFMVTWTSFGQDGSDYGIYGQRFDAEGGMVGDEFHINTVVAGAQDISSITTLADGGFVITWNSLDANALGIFAQKFDANANPVGSEFAINTTTLGGQDGADVAGLQNGGFVVVWNANATDGGITQDGWGGSVQLRIFGADGNPVGGEIQANTYFAFEQINPSVAVLDDGSFVVVWQSINQDGNSWGIFGQHFAADGSKIDAEFAVNTTTDGQQVKPAIGSLPDGGFVVTWTSIEQDGSAGGIYGQRFDADALKVGAERKINDVTANDQINSVVTGLQNGGYAVAYDSYGQEPVIDGIDDSYGVFLRFFYDTPVNPDNDAPIVIAPIADQSYMEGDAVSFDISGSFEDPNVGDLLVFTAAQADGSPLPAWLTLNPTTGGFSGTPPDGGDNVYHIVVTATDAYGATVTETFDLTVGNANPGDAMLVNDTTYSDQLQPSLAALADGNSVVVWSSLGQDGDSWGVFMKIYAPDGSSLSNELQVNTFDSGDQQVPTVTALAAGGFVVTWASFAQDGSAYGVYGQMFAADGTPQGSEFLVNSATTGSQDIPVVTALDDGGFIVAWQANSDQDGSGFGIYSQRYDASGMAVGGETLVNSTTAGSQQLPSIASLNDGGYIVAWQSDSNQDGWASGIYTQRYDAAGVAVGGETLVNSFWVFAQTNASVSALASGGYVVTWQSESQGWFPTEDGDNWGVFAKVYDANGVALTGDVLVNTTTADQQLEPSVTGLPDGGFYVTWTSYGQDGDGAGIYGQQFDAAGNKIGPETLINDLVNGQQLDSAVTLLANGDISVTWTDVPNDGSGYGVFSKIIDLTPNLFTSGDDLIDFNLITAGSYEPGSQYASGDGADMIWLPADAVAATAAGYDLNHAFDAGNGNDMVTGSDLADTIFGGDGQDTLIGGMGNDILDLGAADGDADIVVATLDGGEDMVFNFEVAHDQIDVSAFGFADFSELEPSISMNGSDAVVSLPGGVTISLSLINDEDLTSGNFIF